MNPTAPIVPRIEIPAQAVPHWEQLPRECQNELIQALAALLLRLPQVQRLEEKMRDEREQ
jgi:hypothetical protein